MTRRSGIILATAVFAVFASGARAADIAMIGQPQTQFVLSALLPIYEAATGHKVNVSYEGGAAAMAKVKGGGIDLAIMAPEQIDELLKEGKMVGTRADVFISGIGLAVKAGARKPDIGTVEALKAALLGAKSVARSNARSGQYFASVLERIGIAEQMKSKMIVVGTPVSHRCRQGRRRDRGAAAHRTDAGSGRRCGRPAAGRIADPHLLLGRHSGRRQAGGSRQAADPVLRLAGSRADGPRQGIATRRAVAGAVARIAGARRDHLR